MTYYFKRGPSYRPTDESNVDIRTSLPPGNYVIKQTSDGALVFETVDPFTFKTKRYGDNTRHTRRILDTFMKRDAATGVMLAGEKGSGKSLLAKTVSIEAAQQGIPTIIINAAWHGDAFNGLIQSIQQPAIILFDEFEKVYDQSQQEQILTLLDGVFPTKKLFLFTCNDKWRIDSHMRNRPGRIFYMIDFHGLDKAFIEEYCHDMLKNVSHIPDVIRVSELFVEFNFDMLKALVEEMNRYDESPVQSLRILNVRPEFADVNPTYSMTLTKNGEVLRLYQKTYKGNPFTINDENKISIHYLTTVSATEVDADDEDGEENEESNNGGSPGRQRWSSAIAFGSSELKSVKDNTLTFEKDDLILVLAKVETKGRTDWLDTF